MIKIDSYDSSSSLFDGLSEAEKIENEFYGTLAASSIRFRKEKGLTVEQVAEIADCPAYVIMDFESGRFTF